MLQPYIEVLPHSLIYVAIFVKQIQEKSLTEKYTKIFFVVNST